MFGSSISIKTIAILASCVLLFGAGYWVGDSTVTAEWKEEVAERDLQTAKAMKAMNLEARRLNQELAEAQIKTQQTKTIIETQTVEVEKEVIRYVTHYRDRNMCSLDDGWLRIANESIARTKVIASATDTAGLPSIGTFSRRQTINGAFGIQASP